jgi:hypothetical protein
LAADATEQPPGFPLILSKGVIGAARQARRTLAAVLAAVTE